MTDLEILLPPLSAFIAALFTLMTGFGLGTILTPVFLIFYDVKIAILIVAVVHLLNNLFKLYLFKEHASIELLKRFGVMSLIGAFIGASIQVYIDSEIVKVILGPVLIFLGAKEVSKFADRVHFPKKIDFIGGFFSGLLGGLVGNQGAVRSAYLLNYQISKEAFVATAAAIASIVDITRIPVYIVSNREVLFGHISIIALTLVSAYAGSLAGKKLLQRISLETFKKYVAATIISIGVLLTFKII